MKKGSYKICCFDYEEKKPYAKIVDGYIIDHPSGFMFGATYESGYWYVTELSTGLLVSRSAKPIKKKEDIVPYIDSIIDVVSGITKRNPQYIDRLNNAEVGDDNFKENLF